MSVEAPEISRDNGLLSAVFSSLPETLPVLPPAVQFGVFTSYSRLANLPSTFLCILTTRYSLQSKTSGSFLIPYVLHIPQVWYYVVIRTCSVYDTVLPT